MVRGDRDVIFRRREESDRWINNYVPSILMLWRANMDIQPIVTAEEGWAISVYIMQYMLKDEPNDWLKNVLKSVDPDTPTALSTLLTLSTLNYPHEEPRLVGLRPLFLFGSQAGARSASDLMVGT